MVLKKKISETPTCWHFSTIQARIACSGWLDLYFEHKISINNKYSGSKRKEN